jgi:hypothetical protein
MNAQNEPMIPVEYQQAQTLAGGVRTLLDGDSLFREVETMNEKFQTREEAEKQRDVLNTDFIRRFCPLARCGCQTDCVCWVRAQVVEPSYLQGSETPFQVNEPYCGNAMFAQ